jgi:RPA family protein
MAITRSVAYKVWISDVFSGNYVKQEGFNPNYIELDGKKVSRVNLIATVVGTFMSDDGNYGAITIDDGTETIRMKAFGPDVIRIKNAETGQLVRAVGKIKEYNDERYLAPDFVREIKDPNWIIVQKLELGKPKEVMIKPIENTIEPNGKPTLEQPTETKTDDSKPANESESKVEDKPANEGTTKQSSATKEQSSSEPQGESEGMPNFIELITKLDSGDGADMDKIIAECNVSEAEAKILIIDLLKQGEIYEPRKGKLKVL